MVTASTAGINGQVMPLMPTTTALSLLPFAALNFSLAYMALRTRIRTKTYFGVTSSSSPSSSSTSTTNNDPPKPLGPKSPISAFDPLLVATRAHANFTENVPLGLVIAAVVEMCGADKARLGWALAAFWGFRVVHAVGIFRNSRGRVVGFLGGVSVMMGLAGWGVVLGLR